jgi:TetR/AcrR family fatty acid metabolism transcriptional regulator
MDVMGTKEQILNAAVRVMAAKGQDASIGEIAEAAGVNVSHIYHYFSNKEDLLFHTAGAYLKDRIPNFKRRLEGIREPVSLLTKLIWEQLKFHENNANYARFTLFECRSRKAFFMHEAFRYFFEWTQITKQILTGGKEQGVFSSEVSTAVARDIIQGLMDIENIMFFAGKQKSSFVDDYDGIVDLVLAMIGIEEQPAVEHKNKQTTIVNAAESLFAQKGYGKTTTLEIAKMAGMAERTLYEHFQNKEDILFTTLEHRFKGHQEKVDALFHIEKPLDRLGRFIWYFFTIYLKQPAFAKTLILDGIFNPRFYHSKAYDAFETYLSVIDDILYDGKASGQITGGVDHRIFKNMFLGIFSNTMLRWHFADERHLDIDMARWINEVTFLLTRAVKSRQVQH